MGEVLAAPDVNERIGEESTLYYDHRTKEYHINEMKEMFFQYQKSVALKMLQDGYHDAILSMIRGDLGGPVPEYKSVMCQPTLRNISMSLC